MKRTLISLAAVLLAASAGGAPAQDRQAVRTVNGALAALDRVNADKCGNMGQVRFAPNVRIIETRHVPAAAPGTVQSGPTKLASELPAYCSVTVIINERKGAGGKTYGI